MIATTVVVGHAAQGGQASSGDKTWWALMALLTLVFWALAIVGVGSLRRSPGGGRRRDLGAIDLLDHRLVNGEISTEEHTQRPARSNGRTSDTDAS